MTCEAKFEVASLKSYLVQTRNASITKALSRAYNNQIPGGRLLAFCVSNTDYLDGRKLDNPQSLPLVNLSGIPALRTHCLSVVSDSQHRIITQYLQDDIRALLGEIRLWVQSGDSTASAEEKRVICETLNELERRLKQVSDCSETVYSKEPD